MGILPNNKLLTHKHLNAIIRDSGNRCFVVHVKHYIGDYFVTTLDNQPYAFKIIGSEIMTYNETGVKNYRIAFYSTKHYRPISDKTDMIKELMDKNGVGRINKSMFETLRTLGKREKSNAQFEPHSIEELIDGLIRARDTEVGKILGKENKYQEAAAQVIDFLSSLDTREIVTPTRGIAEYIEDDLLSSDPQFYGAVITTHQRTDIEHKKVTNTAVGGTVPIMKLLVILMMVGMVGAIAFIAYDQGWFDSVTDYANQFSGIGQNISLTPQPVATPGLLEKYDTPEKARAGIAAGEVKLTDFPPAMRDLLK